MDISCRHYKFWLVLACSFGFLLGETGRSYAQTSDSPNSDSVLPNGPSIQRYFNREEYRVSVLHQTTERSSTGLTLDDALENALLINPSVRMLESKIQAAHGRWYQAGRPNNPVLSYAADDIGEEGTAGKHGISFSQTYITADKLELSQAVIYQEIMSLEQSLAVMRMRVATDVRQAFIKVAIQQRRVATARELMQKNQDIANSTSQLLEGLEITKNIFLQANLEVERIRLVLERAKIDLQGAWRQLAVMMAEPTRTEEQVDFDYLVLGEDLDFDWIRDKLLTENPTITSAWAQVERARWAVARARAGAVPNLQVGAVVQHVALTDEVVAGVQVGMAIPYWNKNTGAIQSAHSELIAAQRNVDRLELQLSNQLAIAFKDYQSAKVSVQRYRDVLSPKAIEIVDLVQKRFDAGETNYVNVFTAQRTLLGVQAEWLDSLDRYWESRTLLDGLLLNNHLNQ
ncbi:MAG: TolC family protein [Pirellulales bacterium]